MLQCLRLVVEYSNLSVYKRVIPFWNCWMVWSSSDRKWNDCEDIKE